MSAPRSIEEIQKEITDLKAQIRENDMRIAELKARRDELLSLEESRQ